ncbi:electron transport complex subunit RsxG [Oceanicoccus sp. KOV_DT_Chl]|uniref:electron transport complex subunit RsxG n=1 Tax=Oceanicoccus sp. KOV_DT_Chl TaxID=1904639 RepID=UPI000C7A2B42|nr:electron transport complex subunit RsxG [Oceanicoccus sp. KOV_DT_Chl]
MLGESISRNALLLGFFAVISTAIIAGTFLSSQEAIKENIRQAEERALIQIVPKSRHNNSMLDDAHAISDNELLGLRSEKHYYIARQNNEAVAIIFPATAREGYTGDIDLIIGVNVDGTVAGVRVLSHRETPGLGDAVDYKKSQWVDGFIGKSLVNPGLDLWKVKKDKGVFDQFTGATITPRAVTKAVLQTLQYFDQYQHKILGGKADAKAEIINEASSHE